MDMPISKKAILSLTLKQLRHFTAAAETGQVSRAAELCFVSQPTLTTSLKNLEATLGSSLFTRHAGGLRLTPRGEGFLRYASDALATLEAGIDDGLRLPVQIAGSVRVAITDTVSGYLLPWLIGAMRRELPAVHLELKERSRHDIEAGLRKRHHDLAIVLVSNLSRAADIGRETLARSRRQLWTAPHHPLAAQPRVTLADVAACDFVLLDMDEHVETVRDYWSRHRLQPKVVFSSKSIEAVRSLVAQNVGVTILSDLVYRPWSHDGGRIRRRPLADAVPSMDLGLAYRRDEALSPASQALRKLLRNSAKALAEQAGQA